MVSADPHTCPATVLIGENLWPCCQVVAPLSPTATWITPLAPSAEPRLTPPNADASTRHAVGAVSRVGLPAAHHGAFARALFAPLFSVIESKVIVVRVFLTRLTAALRRATTDAKREKSVASFCVATSAWSMSLAIDCTSAAETTSEAHG